MTWVTGITRMSVLYEQPQEVWERVSTFAGVNDEFGSLLRMSAPAGARIDATVPIGRRWFRSRLLLFGVLPVEYDDLVFTAIEPGRRFHERSSMSPCACGSMSGALSRIPDGCIVRRQRQLERPLSSLCPTSWCAQSSTARSSIATAAYGDTSAADRCRLSARHRLSLLPTTVPIPTPTTVLRKGGTGPRFAHRPNTRLPIGAAFSPSQSRESPIRGEQRRGRDSNPRIGGYPINGFRARHRRRRILDECWIPPACRGSLGKRLGESRRPVPGVALATRSELGAPIVLSGGGDRRVLAGRPLRAGPQRVACTVAGLMAGC